MQFKHWVISLAYFLYISFFNWYKIWDSRKEFSEQLLGGKSICVIQVLPRETLHQVPATGQLIVHENICIFFYLHLLHFYLRTQGLVNICLINKENWNTTSWHTLHLCIPLSSYLKDVDLGLSCCAIILYVIKPQKSYDMSVSMWYETHMVFREKV